MENENRELQEQELPEEEVLTEEELQIPAEPRPTWQRVAAWVTVILFIAVVAMFYINMFRGGK